MPLSDKKSLLDSSSAILLYKGNLLEKLLSTYQVVLAQTVFEELTITGYSGAGLFIELEKKKRITVLENAGRKEKREKRFSFLDGGERQTIACYQEGEGDFIIVDDKKAAHYCRDKNIPYINALLFVRILLYCNAVGYDEYLTHMETIISIGRYSDYVIDFSYNCQLSDLDLFLP